MNHIEQAYEKGLRIREKIWDENLWIKKYSSTQSIDENGDIWGSNWTSNWTFDKHPDNWEIYHEDLPLFTQPNTLPETLIINGIKYKRDDN